MTVLAKLEMEFGFSMYALIDKENKLPCPPPPRLGREEAAGIRRRRWKKEGEIWWKEVERFTMAVKKEALLRCWIILTSCLYTLSSSPYQAFFKTTTTKNNGFFFSLLLDC